MTFAHSACEREIRGIALLLTAPPCSVQEADLAPWTRPYSLSADRLYKRILPLRMSRAHLAQAIFGQDDDFTAAAARFAPGGALAGAAIRLHRRDHAAGLLCGGGFAAQGAAACRVGRCRQRHRRRRRPRRSE